MAYHNTKQMFGFQYVPLEEMDERLFGPGEGLGDRVFKGCVGIMENLAEEIVGCFPGKVGRLDFSQIRYLSDIYLHSLSRRRSRPWSFLES